MRDEDGSLLEKAVQSVVCRVERDGFQITAPVFAISFDAASGRVRDDGEGLKTKAALEGRPIIITIAITIL